MFLLDYFKQQHQKLWKIIRRTFVEELPFKRITPLQCTIYYLTKNFTTDTFLKASKKVRCFNILKILTKLLQNCAFFSNITGLKPRISDFNKNRRKEKCFPSLFWNSWKFAQKRSIMKSFCQNNRILSRILTFLKNWHPEFFRDIQENCCFKCFGKFPEKYFQQYSFQVIRVIQSTIYNYTENRFHRKCFCECSNNFQNYWNRFLVK